MCWPGGSAGGSCDHCSCGCQGLARNEATQDLPDVSKLVTSFSELLGKLLNAASVFSSLSALLTKPGGQHCWGTFCQYPLEMEFLVMIVAVAAGDTIVADAIGARVTGPCLTASGAAGSAARSSSLPVLTGWADGAPPHCRTVCPWNHLCSPQ